MERISNQKIYRETKMKKTAILFILFFLFSTLHAYQNSYTREQVIKDFNDGNTQKYRNDNLQELTFKTLQKKGILTDESLLTNTSTTDFQLDQLMRNVGNTYNHFYSTGGAI